MNKKELRARLASLMTEYTYPELYEKAGELANETQEAPEDVELSDLRTIAAGYRLQIFQFCKTSRILPAGWARDLYVALGRQLVAHPGGRPRLSKATRSLMVSIDAELMDKIDAEAGAEGKTKRQVVETALKAYFKATGKKQKELSSNP